MSGFGYLVSEIVICLLLAAALGFLICWLWRALIADRKAEEADRDWSGRLERTEATYRDLDSKLRTAEEEHAQARAEHDKSVAALTADLEGRTEELESVRSQLTECQESNTRSKAEIETLRGGPDTSREAAEPVLAVTAIDGASDLEARLAEKDQQIRQLEQQLAAMDKLAGESLEPDDLQRIRGIGPVLEKMLNGVGVFTFRQIAAWDAADIAWAAAKLDAFSDRIERDEWVDQARELYREKMVGES